MNAKIVNGKLIVAAERRDPRHYSSAHLTTLYDQEYMAGVREKLRFIKDMQAEQVKEKALTL